MNTATNSEVATAAPTADAVKLERLQTWLSTEIARTFAPGYQTGIVGEMNALSTVMARQVLSKVSNKLQQIRDGKDVNRG